MFKEIKENMIREVNRSAILESVINGKQISRVQIANQTRLSKASVSEIVKELIGLGIIEEIGIGESTFLGGRKPVLLQICKSACLYISIDLGYNYIKLLLTFMNGEKVADIAYENEVIDRDGIIERLHKIIDEVIYSIPKTKYGLMAITLGIHGAVLEDRIEFTPYYDLVHLPMQEELQKIYHVPVYYENEANLSAIANHSLNNAYRNVISISIHSGVGSGIITNDILYNGSQGFSGEIGHMILFPNGKVCPCGNSGCLETYCSQKAIEDEFSHYLKREIRLEDIRAMYDENDSFTINKISELAQYLSIGVNNLCIMFDPQIIYFNCDLVRIFPELILQIRQYLTSFLSKKSLIEISPIANESILIGGILNCLKKSLLVDHIQLKNLGFEIKG